MRALTAVVAVGFGVSTLAGCNLLKKKVDVDAGATTTVATDSAPTPTVPATPAISNEKDVKRYPDEALLDGGAALTVRAFVADVVKEAGATTPQTLIATVKKGTTVTAVANETVLGVVYTLVTFADPSTPGNTEEGWMNHHKAFDYIPIDAGVIKRRACPAGQVAILTGDGDQCVLACSAAVACPGNLACSGDGSSENLDGTAGPDISFCIAGTPPTPGAVDAGAPAPAAVDAGAPPAAVDAAAPPAVHKPTVTRAQGLPPKCLDPAYQQEGIVCRLKCTAATDCAATTGSQCQAGLCNP
jgi:hypothetical protein